MKANARSMITTATLTLAAGLFLGGCSSQPTSARFIQPTSNAQARLDQAPAEITPQRGLTATDGLGAHVFPVSYPLVGMARR